MHYRAIYNNQCLFNMLYTPSTFHFPRQEMQKRNIDLSARRTQQGSRVMSLCIYIYIHMLIQTKTTARCFLPCLWFLIFWSLVFKHFFVSFSSVLGCNMFVLVPQVATQKLRLRSWLTTPCWIVVLDAAARETRKLSIQATSQGVDLQNQKVDFPYKNPWFVVGEYEYVCCWGDSGHFWNITIYWLQYVFGVVPSNRSIITYSNDDVTIYFGIFVFLGRYLTLTRSDTVLQEEQRKVYQCHRIHHQSSCLEIYLSFQAWSCIQHGKIC